MPHPNSWQYPLINYLAQTQESFIMKVAPLPPLPYFELNPSLEGLNLQVHENMQKYYQNQDSAKSSRIEKEQFPQIGSVFSFDELEQQQQVGNDQVPRTTPSNRNDIIDLWDSDWDWNWDKM